MNFILKWISCSRNLGGREFTENPWQHIKLSHLSLQTRFSSSNTGLYFSAFMKTNCKSEDHLKISWELFRQMGILCNSAANGFSEASDFHLIKTSTQLQSRKISIFSLKYILNIFILLLNSKGVVSHSFHFLKESSQRMWSK